MGRYKGRIDGRAMRAAFPHVVELAVPSGGFGRQLDAMNAWHAARGLIVKQGRGRYEEPQHFVTWRFAKFSDAEAFETSFGGTLLPSSAMPDDPWEAVLWAGRLLRMR